MVKNLLFWNVYLNIRKNIMTLISMNSFGIYPRKISDLIVWFVIKYAFLKCLHKHEKTHHGIDINKQAEIDPSKIFELIVCFVIKIWFFEMSTSVNMNKIIISMISIVWHKSKENSWVNCVICHQNFPFWNVYLDLKVIMILILAPLILIFYPFDFVFNFN